MSNRPRRERDGRAAARRKMAEHIVEKAWLGEVQLKAAMLVIHRVRRTMDLPLETAAEVQKQREAMDLLIRFADAHALPPELEELL